MTIKERILEFIQAKNLSVREFERAAGLSNGYLKALRKSPTADKMRSILYAYPEINSRWLFEGSGNMFDQEPSMPAATDDTRPRVPLDAAAGALTHAADGVTIDQCEQLPTIRQFPRYDFTIRIAGDSMLPEYHSGDEVACLHVNEASFLQWGRTYVLDTAQGILIKRIYDAGDSIRCVSFNADFPDFEVKKAEIYSFSLVVASFRI